MKKTWALAAFLVVFSLLLTGCACEHRWMAADCLQPQICEECREVGAPALGHDWREATCEKSKTCARCGVTEGEALGHSLGSWTFTQEQMTRACDRCGFAETAQTDRELYLETLLPGNWYLYGVVQGENYSYAAHMGFTEVHLSFDGERKEKTSTHGSIKSPLPNKCSIWRFGAKSSIRSASPYLTPRTRNGRSCTHSLRTSD